MLSPTDPASRGTPTRIGGAQEEQTRSPHPRQWWRLTTSVKFLSQIKQLDEVLFGIQQECFLVTRPASSTNGLCCSLDILCSASDSNESRASARSPPLLSLQLKKPEEMRGNREEPRRMAPLLCFPALLPAQQWVNHVQ